MLSPYTYPSLTISLTGSSLFLQQCLPLYISQLYTRCSFSWTYSFLRITDVNFKSYFVMHLHNTVTELSRRNIFYLVKDFLCGDIWGRRFPVRERQNTQKSPLQEGQFQRVEIPATPFQFRPGMTKVIMFPNRSQSPTCTILPSASLTVRSYPTVSPSKCLIIQRCR